MAVSSKVIIIDLIFRDQAYIHMVYSIQRLIKSAFHRIHQMVVEVALCYSLACAVIFLYYSHAIPLILEF